MKCFNQDTTKWLQNNPAWNKDSIKVVIKFLCLLGQLVVLMKKNIII